MATPMCISEDGNKATFIGTFLETGDNVRLCDECMPNFCAAVFERMTGVDMTPALYLASVEGQENPDGPSGQPEEVAYPPDMEPRSTSDVDPTGEPSGRSAEHTTAEGAPSSQPPPPAPADTDQAAAEDPISEGSPTAGVKAPASMNSSSEPGQETDRPPQTRARKQTAGR